MSERVDENRVLGIDYGTRRIGLAISDPTGIIALPLEILEVGDDAEGVSRVAAVAADRGVERFVVGLPLNMNGTRGPMAEAADHFRQALSEATGLPAVAWDERLSTSAVDRMLIEAGTSRGKRKRARDKLAAQVILQSWLDARGEPAW